MINLEPFSTQLFPYLLVGARVAGALSILPGFSESFITSRIRVVLVMCLSIGLTPLVVPEDFLVRDFPPFILLREVLIGLIFGMLVKLTFIGIDVGGNLISQQMGVTNAFVSTPIHSGSLPATFLFTVAIFLLFFANIHHLMLESLVATYVSFPLIPTLESLAPLYTRVIEQAMEIITLSFKIALQLAAPILVISFILNSGFGLFNRLIPTIQVFFIMVPLQISIGFIVLTMSIHLTLPLFMDFVARIVQQLLQ